MGLSAQTCPRMPFAARAKKWVFHDEHASLLAQNGSARWLLVAAAGEADDGQRNGGQAVSRHR